MITPLRKNYGAQMISPNGQLKHNNLVFQFEAVPPGYIWTGSISIVTTQSLTSGPQSVDPPGSFSNNDFLANAQWTLYRNGAAEITWIGLSMLCNFQAFGNDIITVTGFLPQSGVSPITANSIFTSADPALSLTLVFNGYAGTTNEIALTTAFLSTAVQAAPNQSVSTPGNLMTTAWTGHITTLGTFPVPTIVAGIRIWNAWISLAVIGTAAASSWAAELFDLSGIPLCAVNAATDGVSTISADQSIAVPLFGLYESNAGLTFKVSAPVGAGSASVLLASAGVSYTTETLAIPV
jgi:hypothetical protein